MGKEGKMRRLDKGGKWKRLLKTWDGITPLGEAVLRK